MLMSEWKSSKLNELGFVGRGKSRHRPRNADFLYGGSYPFFQTGDIKAADFYLTKYTQTYSEAGLAQSKLWKPGTLCITIAANIAESAILGIEGCFPDSVVGFIADPQKADVRFIKYYMDTLKLRMQNISHGATQDNLSVDKLLSFDFNIPPLPLQRRIAGILSAYDELIENSQRRIKILETMARALYREWFIHFRYPGSGRETGNEPSTRPEGHPSPMLRTLTPASPKGRGAGRREDDDVKISFPSASGRGARGEGAELVDSALGKIPKGWEVTTLGRLVEIRKGKNITKDTIRDGNIPVVAGGIAPAYFHDTPNTQSPVITISASGANAGYVNLYYVDVWASDCSYIDLSATPHVFYYYLWLDRRRADITHLQRGSAQPHVYPKDLVQLEAIGAPEEVLNAFMSQVAPVFGLIMRLTSKIENLRRTRDLLLPRLLSRQVDIKGEQ